MTKGKQEKKRVPFGSTLQTAKNVQLLPRNHRLRVQTGPVIEISFGETPAVALGPTTPHSMLAFRGRCTVTHAFSHGCVHVSLTSDVRGKGRSGIYSLYRVSAYSRFHVEHRTKLRFRGL